MRGMKLLITMVACAAIVVHGVAIAGTWKPMCVNGSAGQGTPNGTWKQLSSASAGGGTWKPLGGCAVAAPIYYFTLNAGYDGQYSSGYRDRALGDAYPMGSISGQYLMGYKIIEVAQFGGQFEIVVEGSVPQNLFTSVTLNGFTFQTNQASYSPNGLYNNYGIQGTAWTWGGNANISPNRAYTMAVQ